MVDKMPAAEVTVDADLVRALLSDQHPDLATLDLRPIAFGWDNVVFRLGADLAVRLPRRQQAALLVEHEQRWLPQLAPTLPLPIPTPVRVGRPAAGYPWAWSVVGWMDGGEAATSPPDDATEAAVVLGGFLRALHRPAPLDAPINRYRGIPLPERDDLTRHAIAKLAGEIDASSVLARWEERAATPAWAGPSLWLHGDLHPANLVVREGRLAGVIDFGDLTSGDPATDLMVAWALLPSTVHPTFREAAGEIDDDTWRRARGWALAHAVVCLASSADNPVIAGMGRRGLAAVLADPG